jgi:hypothetical protein
MCFTCHCSHCGGHLEFDGDHAGEEITCPLCAEQTLLCIPKPEPEPPKKHIDPAELLNMEIPIGDLTKRARQALPSLALFAVLVVAVWGFVAYSQHKAEKERREWDALVHPPKEPYEATAKRYHAEGKQVWQEAYQKEVVGFHRLVDGYFDDMGDSPQKWKASATVEFVNKVGGIEHTNMHFTFRLSERDPKFPEFKRYVRCDVDWDWFNRDLLRPGPPAFPRQVLPRLGSPQGAHSLAFNRSGSATAIRPAPYPLRPRPSLRSASRF